MWSIIQKCDTFYVCDVMERIEKSRVEQIDDNVIHGDVRRL